MTASNPAEFQRLLAAAFDAQGWEYDLAIGAQIVQAIQTQGKVDPAQLTSAMPGAFFERNRVDRSLVQRAIEGAIGGRTLKEEEAVPATIVIGGNNYQLNVGAGASIVNSNVNVGDGTQITVSADADKQDVLLAVEAIVRAGLAGDWNDDASRDLAVVVNARPDVDYEEIQKVAREVVSAEQPTKQRVKGFLTRIAASGLSGALATGITAGLGEAITHLPF
jgi:hypothetical protein